MLIRRFDPLDDDACARAHEVVAAARRLGRPWHHPPSLAESVLEWRHDDPGERMEMWEAVVPDPEDPADGTDPGHRGRLVGVGTIWLSLDDNTRKAWVEVVVDPADRRRGAGRALTERLLERARDEGRTEVLTEVAVPPDPDGVDRHPYLRWAEALGFTTTSTDLERHLRLPPDPALLDTSTRRPARTGSTTTGWRPTSTACPPTCRKVSAR